MNNKPTKKETMLYMDERVALKNQVSDLLYTISVIANDLLSYQESIDRLDGISLDKVKDLQSSLVTFSDICEGGVVLECQVAQASLGMFVQEIKEDREQIDNN
tara:strand:+ start:503 stop:811 length:309 start_codon:yes stop_codon:yes gene_type:complete